MTAGDRRGRPAARRDAVTVITVLFTGSLSLILVAVTILGL